MKFLEIIINFFKRRKQKHEKKHYEIVEKYKDIALLCQNANSECTKMKNSPGYIDYPMRNNWLADNKVIFETVRKDNAYSKLNLDEESNHIDNFKTNYYNFETMCNVHNKWFVEYEKSHCQELFDNIEGRALDDQQRECIVKDEVNNLVIAGAGSGKTTTIVGKVKYLLERYKYNPNEMLILSFTNASSKEMSERINRETGVKIDTMNFHTLGLRVISQVEEKPRSLTKIKLLDYTNEKFNILTKDPTYNELVNKYFLSYLKPYKSIFDFKCMGDYYDYLRDTKIITLNKEIVKSYEEMEIANFLLVNNVKYKYEAKYEHDTRDIDHRQYEPDFYLPEYKIYIEHYGINKNGDVPDYFEGVEGKTAKEVYNDRIQWKRKTHNEYGTKLIETFSYEKTEGVLTENLKQKLLKHGVSLTPLPRDKVWELIEHDKDYDLTNFVKLLENFITLMKTFGYSVEDIKTINNNYMNYFDRQRNEAFINIIAPIYLSYKDELEKNEDIDFSDMINKAVDYIREGKYLKKYSYIIVDEYQDISLTRYNLIKAIKDINNARLFCVGDDWQSIYRFAGSAINLFTDFEKFYGFTEKSFIETTYRFDKSIIELSGNFILKNKAQFKKQLRPYKENNNRKSYDLIYGDSIENLKASLKEKLMELPPKSTVALLGRYNKDIDFKGYIDAEIKCSFDHKTEKWIVKYDKRNDLEIEFLTVHKSKGLQADYVFIMNNTNKRFGFPSQIQDDPILKLFYRDVEVHPFAEERRLFYVALTRAKKFVWLFVENRYKSPFIREIEEDYKLRNLDQKVVYCNVCKKGEMVIRTTMKDSTKKFYGCSNYPFCKNVKWNIS